MIPPQPTAAFDPSAVQTDPGFGWRLSQGVKARERGAAARGTLLTGGAQKSLDEYGQGLASQEYGNAYQRALQTYTTNRDTTAQNAALAPPSAQTAGAGSLAAPSPTQMVAPAAVPDAQTYQTQMLQYRQQQEAERQLAEERLATERTRQDALRTTGMQLQEVDRVHADERLGDDRRRQEDQRTTGMQLQAQDRLRAEEAQQREVEAQQQRELEQRQLRGNATLAAPRPTALSLPQVDHYADTVARLEQQQREIDARLREQIARENAARGDQRPVPVYLRQYVGAGRG